MKYSKIIGLLFSVLTVAFIAISVLNAQFFDWVFDRHHNQWSWYLRPIFLIPFCYYAYKRNLAGISVTIFCLFTSMFWFSRPAVVDEQVVNFLQFEKDWLQSDWDYKKILSILLIPISLFVLAKAFWGRRIYLGLVALVIIATGKILWSIHNAGEAGTSIIPPAIFGILFCLGLIFIDSIESKKKI